MALKKIHRSQLDQVLAQPVPDGLYPIDSEAPEPDWPRFAVPRPARTSYVVAGGRVQHLQTILSGDIVLGWDLCHGCARHVRVCECPGGVSTTPWILRESGYVEKPVYAAEKVWAPIRMEKPVPTPRRQAEPAARTVPTVAPAPVGPPPTMSEIQAAAKDQADTLADRLRKRLRIGH